MKRPFAALCLLPLLLATAHAQAPRGPVHNERAAILMARRIWINLNPPDTNPGSPADWLKNDKATRDGEMWEVGPKNPGPGAMGDGTIFRIASEDGHMMGMLRP